jgi:uncharacterized RmlC-like cupin family protein
MARDWTNAVRIVRGSALDAQRHDPAGTGRATVLDFAGIGGGNGAVWIGAVSLKPGGVVPPHHHGRHEVAIGLTSGRMELKWGDTFEHSAELGAGDYAYFAPGVPHQERNPSATERVDYFAIRSDNERLITKLSDTPV